jgi:hypothetical protein
MSNTTVTAAHTIASTITDTNLNITKNHLLLSAYHLCDTLACGLAARNNLFIKQITK